MASNKKGNLVTFSRMDGIIRNFEVPVGTTLKTLLSKVGYAEAEQGSLLAELRINGAEAAQGLETVLAANSFVTVTPPVKSGSR